MVTLNFEIEPDQHGIMDGCVLARDMIYVAYELVAAYAQGDERIADKMFNGVLLSALDDVATRKAAVAREGGTPMTYIMADQVPKEKVAEAFVRHMADHDREQEYIANWYGKFLSVTERGQREGFAVAAAMNHELKGR